MEVTKTSLNGVVILQPARFGDDRGFFSESWSRRRLSGAGIDLDFVQDNHSVSAHAGTLRGLHFQSPPCAQAKLVRCGRGALLDVAVDIRAGSATYGQWIGIELSAANGRQLLIPTGFLHGFVTLVDDTEIIYKCSDYYAPDCDGSVAWDSVGIEWGLTATPILSAKDAAAVPFARFQTPFTCEG